MQRILRVGLSLVVGLPGAAMGQAPEVTGWIARIGTDTVAIERVLRTPTRLEGEWLFRVPQTSIQRWEADLTPTGRIRRFRIVRFTADGVPMTPRWQRDFVFRDDSVTTEMVVGDSITTRTDPMRAGAVPLLHPFLSYGAFDQVMRQSLQGVRVDSQVVVFLPPGSTREYKSSLVRVGPDSVRLSWAGNSLLWAKVDGEGRLLGMHSLESTLKAIGERVTDLAFWTLARDFSTQDQGGAGLGILSIRDTVRADVTGASVWIDYSRPVRRGRTIFGVIVPYNKVWRAGADAATQFETNRDLLLGEKRVPAGRYTLWIIPAEAGDTLVVNRQVGQWGTQYSSSQDLLRVPLERTALPTTVEQYTIRVDPIEHGGLLSFTWDRRRFSIPLRVAH